jgi:hypothetical protein
MRLLPARAVEAKEVLDEDPGTLNNLLGLVKSKRPEERPSAGVELMMFDFFCCLKVIVHDF